MRQLLLRRIVLGALVLVSLHQKPTIVHASPPPPSHHAIDNSNTIATTIMTMATTTRDRISETILSNILSWKQQQQQASGNTITSTTPSSGEHRRPFVTLTYAQTLDGMIAATTNNAPTSNNTTASNTNRSEDDADTTTTTPFTPNTNKTNNISTNLKISCEETFLMTHALRSIHDAILIGGNTLYSDNPRLNNRLWHTIISSTSSEGGQLQRQQNEEEEDPKQQLNQPIPIILDTELRHVLKLVRDGTLIKSCRSHRHSRKTNTYLLVCCTREAYEEFGREIRDATRIQSMGESTEDEFYEDGGGGGDSNTIRFVVCERNQLHDNIMSGGGSTGGLDLKYVLEKLRRDH